MEHIRVKQVMEAANGRLLCGNEEQVLANISLDSRNMSGLDLFVPIVGEKVQPSTPRPLTVVVCESVPTQESR